jgi:SAM-dependent methyltransferase
MRMRSTVRDWIRERRPKGVLLEIGGGTSMLRPLIERESPGIRYMSGDISPTNATTVVLDATNLPVQDESVNAVLALEVLEHIPEPKRMLQEISRTLTPGGVCILTVPFMVGVHDFRDYFRYTPLGLEALLVDTGLELDETRLRGGTFVSAASLLKSLIRNAILGSPEDWRAQGARKKVLWIIVVLAEMPWVPIMWGSMGLDHLLDRESVSPPGYFFLCTKRATA